MAENDGSPVKKATDGEVMDDIKAVVLTLNAALELAARRDINVQITLHSTTRMELNVPAVSLTLDAAHKVLYAPMIVRPH